MSALFERLVRMFRESHDAAPPALWRDPRLLGTETFTPAAVLIAMTERERPGVLLLHRPSNMRSHPGQIAFPGGKLDPGEDAIEAALREAHEELGIRPDDVRVIGASDVYHTGSGFEVTPVLGLVPPDIQIHPSPTEVAQWFEAPADFIFDPANQVQKWVDYEGAQHSFIEIQWQEHCIWGVTGAIIFNLTRRLKWHG